MSNANGSANVRRWSEVDAVGIGAVIVVTGLFYFAVVKPLIDARATADAQRSELKAQEDRAAKTATAVQAARERLDAIRKAIADNPQKLEPVRALNNRLSRITAAATARSLEITDIRPAAAAAGTHFVTVPISLSGSGSFRDCVGYLHDLHERFADTAVTSVKLASSGNDAKGGITFDLQLLWHAALEPRVDGAQTASIR